MKYLIWSNIVKDHCKDFSQGSFVDKELISSFRLPNTSWKNDLPQNLEIKISYDKEVLDIFYTGSFVTVSEKVKSFFDQIKDSSEQLEFIPIKPVNIQNKNFYFLNFLKSYNILDENNSIYSTDLEKIDDVEKLKIDYKKINQKKFIFQLDSWVRIVFMREDICKSFKKENITGINFIEEENWKPY